MGDVDPGTWQQKVCNGNYANLIELQVLEAGIRSTLGRVAFHLDMQGAALAAEMMRLKAIEEASEQHQSQLTKLQVTYRLRAQTAMSEFTRRSSQCMERGRGRLYMRSAPSA